MVRHVTIKKFCDLTGYSEDAIRQKMSRGDWLEGAVYHRAPDNRILINIEEYDLWAEGKMESTQHHRVASR